MAEPIVIKEGDERDGLRTYANRIDAVGLPHGAQVTMCYPSREKPTRVTVGIMDVRAANSIAIEYDFKRDGYVIRMDRTKCYGTGCDVVEEDVEVAFVPAWLEESEV